MKQPDKSQPVVVQSGVYLITNQRNKKSYVGSTINFQSRWLKHRNSLRRGTHDNPHLQQSWLKYGEAVFEYTILELVEPYAARLCEREQAWFEQLRPEYNIRIVVASNLGLKHSKPRSAEQRAKIGAASRRYYETHPGPNAGRVFDDEFRRKVSDAAKERTPYTRTKAHREAAGSMMKAHLAANPRSIKPPEPCTHCRRSVKVRRHGLCGACSEYRRRRGVDRPLSLEDPAGTAAAPLGP